MKNKNFVVCPNCKSLETKKNGTRKGVQRYYCKNCKKTFCEEHFSLKEKRLISMLISLINGTNGKGLSLKEVLKTLDTKIANTNEVEFVQKVPSDLKRVICYNPRLLICYDDENHYTFYRLPESNTEDISRCIFGFN